MLLYSHFPKVIGIMSPILTVRVASRLCILYFCTNNTFDMDENQRPYTVHDTSVKNQSIGSVKAGLSVTKAATLYAFPRALHMILLISSKTLDPLQIYGALDVQRSLQMGTHPCWSGMLESTGVRLLLSSQTRFSLMHPLRLFAGHWLQRDTTGG